jgi:uncharacterized protein (DUF3820 family)
VKPENEIVVECSADFTETEQKLIRLGLNTAARGNEIDTAAIKLFHSLRKRGVTSEEVIGETGGNPPLSADLLARARRLRMPFGKHRGRPLMVIEASYLRWALRDCHCLSLDLREAIQLVLRHCGGRN